MTIDIIDLGEIKWPYSLLHTGPGSKKKDLVLIHIQSGSKVLGHIKILDSKSYFYFKLEPYLITDHKAHLWHYYPNPFVWIRSIKYTEHKETQLLCMRRVNDRGYAAIRVRTLAGDYRDGLLSDNEICTVDSCLWFCF